MLKSEKRSIKTADFICPEEKKACLKAVLGAIFLCQKALTETAIYYITKGNTFI